MVMAKLRVKGLELQLELAKVLGKVKWTVLLMLFRCWLVRRMLGRVCIR
jgi:flagellar biogenesis protein FliO